MWERAGPYARITWRLLERLRQADGKIVTYQALIDAAYGVIDPPDFDLACGSIATAISRQRKRFGKDFVENYSGLGFAMPVQHHDKFPRIDERSLVPIEEFRFIQKLSKDNPNDVRDGKHPDQGADSAGLPEQNPRAEPYRSD